MGNISMQPAYDYARALELSFKLTGEQSNSVHRNQGSNRNKYKIERNGQSLGVSKENGSTHKDHNAISWGQMKCGEFGLYRREDRCGGCGKKGWSDPDHPCRTKRVRRMAPITLKRVTPDVGAATKGSFVNELPYLSALKYAEEDSWMYEGFLAGHPVQTVIDSYDSHSFMSVHGAKRLNLELKDVKDVEVELGDTSKTKILGKAHTILNVNVFLSEEQILVINMKEDSDVPELILGRTWLQDHNPNIDWHTNVLKVTRSDRTVVTI